MKNLLILACCTFACLTVYGQDLPVDYSLGEKYNDRYKYSNLMTIADDGSGGSILVRAYYTGIILKPKGYFIERYDENMQLISEYNYKLKGSDFVNGYVKNGQLYLLFLKYDLERLAYDYVIHRSPISDINFTQETILSITSEQVNTM